MLELDHIAIATERLEDGVAWLEETLGVQMAQGGEHPLMGTHNRLLGLADGLYLEVIAINPDAPVPEHPRWFDLDRFQGGPRLTNWIVRCDDMASTLAQVPAGVGVPQALSRGDLRWQMAVPTTGILPYDNCCPALIQWEGSAHPAHRLPGSGCRLTGLEVSHPEAEALAATLGSVFSDDRVSYRVGEPGLHAQFDTPQGERVI